MAPAAAFIPALIGAGGGIASSIIGGKAGKAAMKPSPEEAGYLRRQSGLVDLLKGQAETTFNTGMPAINEAQQYYQTMARGDRSKMSQAIAPSVAQITQQYRGAEGSINRNLRGAQRQQQQGELRRDRASKLALLTTGQQPAAYDAMNQTGQALIGHSSGSAARGGSILDSMTRNAGDRRQYGMDVGRDVSKSMGGILADILKNTGGGKGGKKGGGVTGGQGEMWPGTPPIYGGDYRVPSFK
jgi:hypothetical protein